MSKIKIHKLVPSQGWIQLPTPRLHPLKENRLPLVHKIVLRRMARRAKVSAPNLFLTLIRSKLFPVWALFAAKLMPWGLLKRVDTELIILRVAWLCRCKYEWYQHVLIGLDAGLSLQDIKRVPQGPNDKGWNPHQASLLQAVDDIHSTGIISDATWQTLTRSYDDKKLIELCMLIGNYSMLADIINSLGIEIEASLEEAIQNI